MTLVMEMRTGQTLGKSQVGCARTCCLHLVVTDLHALLRLQRSSCAIRITRISHNYSQLQASVEEEELTPDEVRFTTGAVSLNMTVTFAVIGAVLMGDGDEDEEGEGLEDEEIGVGVEDGVGVCNAVA